MESEYSIIQAIEDGNLLDVTDVAKRLHGSNYECSCPVYITTAAWESDEIASDESKLMAAIEAISVDQLASLLYEMDVPKFILGVDSTHRDGFKSRGHIIALLEISSPDIEPFRATLFLYRAGESVDFRVPRAAAGGSFYAM